jgi:hypothetical protein
MEQAENASRENSNASIPGLRSVRENLCRP